MTATVDVTPNPAFASFTRSVTSGGGNLFESAGLGPAIVAPGSGPVYQIEVGVFQFTGMSPGIATLTASVDGSGHDNVGGDNTVLDNLTGRRHGHPLCRRRRSSAGAGLDAAAGTRRDWPGGLCTMARAAWLLTNTSLTKRGL